MNLFRPQSAIRNPKSLIGAAFTVTELLVVITLIVILILIAVPSFSAMIYSSEEAMAESALRGALRASRDAAVRSNGAGDGAAVFFFEPGGRVSVLPCVKVGELSDWTDSAAANTDTTRREIFAAAPGFTAVLLPKYWNVRGFTPAHSITAQWYGQALSGTPTVPVNNAARAWVFPETGFYDQNKNDDGYMRSSFMVRFRAGSGELVGASTSPALVFAPRPSSQNRTGVFNDYRADRAEDPVRFIRQVLGKPKTGPADAITDKRNLIGRFSSDMVLARPVMQVALYNERRMAGALGVSLDRVTDSIYADATSPSFVATSLNANKISSYIEGDENADGVVDDKDRPNTRIFAIDRYSGALRPVEVQP